MDTTIFNTSRLGFGLSSIAGSGNFSHQEKLVKNAIECGITHFDVAPYYGNGDAEKILGDILANCHDKVTITTKFGLVPFSGGKSGRLLRATLRPIFRRLNTLKRLVSILVSHAHHQPEQIDFINGSLTSSIDESIKKLRRPVDIFLLHDIEALLAKNLTLIEELDKAKTTGKTLMTGISGSVKNVEEMVTWRNSTYKIAQLENSLLNEAPIKQLESSGAMLITHRAIQGGLKELTFLIEKRPNFKSIWLREFGIEPSKDNLVNILIELALTENPKGTVLFSTTRPDRINKIAEVITKPLLGNDGCALLRKIYNEVKMVESSIK